MRSRRTFAWVGSHRPGRLVPPAGQEVAERAGGRLAELVGARGLDVETPVPDSKNVGWVAVRVGSGHGSPSGRLDRDRLQRRPGLLARGVATPGSGGAGPARRGCGRYLLAVSGRRWGWPGGRPPSGRTA